MESGGKVYGATDDLDAPLLMDLQGKHRLPEKYAIVIPSSITKPTPRTEYYLSEYVKCKYDYEKAKKALNPDDPLLQTPVPVVLPTVLVDASDRW